MALFFVFCFSFSSAATYYVTNTGSASSAGSAAAPWSLVHATATARAGDTVHVRAGVYANVKILMTQSGTQGSPIRFIGYRSTPGDIVSTSQPTWMYNNPMTGADMPLIRENRAGSVGSGVGLEVRGAFIHWENFQIRYYDKNLVVRGDDFVGKNIIVRDAGNFASKTAYAGVGMQISANRGVYTNLVCVNAGAQCISTYGDYNRHTNVYITCDQVIFSSFRFTYLLTHHRTRI
jgi:dipeptidyl aminopeptidase/acylaminoacyl peptidase